MKTRDRETEAPSRWDESCSRNSLRPSPWVRRRIKELGYEGKLVKHWVPPQCEDSASTIRTLLERMK